MKVGPHRCVVPVPSPPLLAPPPPSLTRTEGHVATLDGLRLVPLAAPTTLAAFAYNLPLLDAFPAARRALRPDRQTDSQGWIGGSWHAPIATLEEYLLANNDSSAEYCFLIRVFPPPLQQTPNVLRWGAQGRYIPCLILSFPTNFGEKITGSHTFISIPMRPACSISTWPSHPAPIPLLPTPLCARGGGLPPPSPAHLRPSARPPLCGTGQAAAGPARLGPLAGAVFGVQGSVGAVLQALHALHRPRLHPQLAAGPAAGTPFLGHPAARGWKDGHREGVKRGCPTREAASIPPIEGMGAPWDGRGGLTLAGSTPGGYNAAGSASASCRCRRSFYAPSGCRFSAGNRTWCTGCLGGAEHGR